ncbi:hypothetical protein J1N35_026351 [Gossypium stocksii]|uniref:Uncharacterized protein n=1 Tax=Gossypium stocksii TaxID=47602 RepID=A0A9D3VAI7_9ROSI|nr:hypothetical protein J1N35_026351 [Gossypium stocksii]
METKFQEFKDKFCGDLQALLGQYFKPLANGTTEKEKGVLGALPGFPSKDTRVPNAPVGPSVLPSVDVKIGHYHTLLEPTTMMEVFQLARKIEVLLSCSAKKTSAPLNSSPRSLLNPSVISGYSSASTRIVFASQFVSSVPVNKSASQSISLAVMAE